MAIEIFLKWVERASSVGVPGGVYSDQKAGGSTARLKENAKVVVLHERAVTVLALVLLLSVEQK